VSWQAGFSSSDAVTRIRDRAARIWRPDRLQVLTDLKEPEYCAGVLNLSDKLAQKLKEMRAARTAETRSFAPAAAEHIFLARSTDDMEWREGELSAI
jgi:hypothetical protein